MREKHTKTISALLSMATILVDLIMSNPARADFNFSEEVRDVVLPAAPYLQAPVMNLHRIGDLPVDVSAKGLEEALGLAMDIWRGGNDGLDQFVARGQWLVNDGSRETRNFVIAAMACVWEVADVAEKLGSTTQATMKQRSEELRADGGRWTAIDGHPAAYFDPVEDVRKHWDVFQMGIILQGLRGLIAHAIQPNDGGVGNVADPGGILNVGNTCYFNACSQMLATVPISMWHSLSSAESQQVDRVQQSSRKAVMFSSLNARYPAAMGSPQLALAMLQDALTIKHKGGVHVQQDASEVLAMSICALDHSESSPARMLRKQHVIRAPENGSSEESESDLPSCELCVESPFNIPYSMGENRIEFEDEADTIKNGYRTKIVKTQTEATPGQCIIACLKRFHVHKSWRDAVKDDTPARSVPLHLAHTDTGWVAGGTEMRPEYTMVGAILHGGGLGGGHYRAVVRRNNKWWLCNDSTVCVITEEDALALACDHGYVIAYNKVP